MRKKVGSVIAAIGLATTLGAASLPVAAAADPADVPGVVAPLATKPFETDKAVNAPGAPSGCGVTTSTTGARGCFRLYGDVFFVKDDKADGNSVYIRWQNRLTYKNAAWGLYREGRCEYHGGSGNWGSCNKDFYEMGNTNAHGGTKSQIRIRTCRNVPALPDNCSGWSSWRDNDG